MLLCKSDVSWPHGAKEIRFPSDELVPMVRKEPRESSEPLNEICLNPVDSSRVRWQDRDHFFAISAQSMRTIHRDWRFASTRLRPDLIHGQ
jgi:hypothetical protein